MRVVGAVICHEGMILACRRAPARAAGGLWEFPGGKVEPGESDTAALSRELREELGLDDVAVGDLVNLSTTAVGDLEIELACYLVTIRAEPVLGTDHDCLSWLHPSALETVAWATPDLPAVATLLRAPELGRG